ncbi:MAG: ParB/RepB/Spo0J family partition protein [Firmicutes bacterium]|nr:ParB/RepB/Spo0J family partition protein [Bacillota bacterium]
MAIKKLGRGLGALLSDSDDYLETFEQREAGRGETGQVELPIGDVMRNENQPRKNFDEAAMNELVNSVRLHGVITPIIVVKKDERYMVIAGERRWRAARKAGLSTIPAIIRNYTAQQIKEIALIENLQREDLNPIETANAIKQLMQEYNYTQEAVAERIGKSRSAVANVLGLLTLVPSVIGLIASGRLSSGHAKILTAIDDEKAQYELALRGADGKMSVRKFEQLIKQVKNPETAKGISAPELSLELKDLVYSMQRVFATKVSAIGNDKKGRIYIDYYSRDDLDRLVEIVEIVKNHKLDN